MIFDMDVWFSKYYVTRRLFNCWFSRVINLIAWKKKESFLGFLGLEIQHVARALLLLLYFNFLNSLFRTFAASKRSNACYDEKPLISRITFLSYTKRLFSQLSFFISIFVSRSNKREWHTSLSPSLSLSVAFSPL